MLAGHLPAVAKGLADPNANVCRGVLAVVRDLGPRGRPLAALEG